MNEPRPRPNRLPLKEREMQIGVAYSEPGQQIWLNIEVPDESLVKEVPLPGFTLYNEFKPADIDHFQKFFDVFTERKIFTKKLDVKSLLYTG